MTDVLNFSQGGKLHLLAYEGLVTEVMAALIVLAVLIAFGHEGKRQRSLVWSGGGIFVILLVPGVCMGLEKLSTGSLGNGKSYMTIPAAAILSYGSVRLYEHYGRSFRNRLAVAFAVVIVILAGISVPYTFSLDNYALPENKWKVRPEVLEAADWIGQEIAIVPEDLQSRLLQMGAQTGVLWNHRVIEYTEKDISSVVSTARANQCAYIILEKPMAEEFDRVAAWEVTNYYMQAYGYQKETENDRYILYGLIPPEEPAS